MAETIKIKVLKPFVDKHKGRIVEVGQMMEIESDRLTNLPPDFFVKAEDKRATADNKAAGRRNKRAAK